MDFIARTALSLSVSASLVVRLLLLAIITWYVAPLTRYKKVANDWVDNDPVRFKTIITPSWQLLVATIALVGLNAAACFGEPEVLGPLMHNSISPGVALWVFFLAPVATNIAIFYAGRHYLPNLFDFANRPLLLVRAAVLTAATWLLLLIPHAMANFRLL